ncbi:MAG: DUF2723 domain-containing protein, partial [Anaerolineae bacterium]|nr:DUF2723 domain-containing protein [Anaerolineae bacterium]
MNTPRIAYYVSRLAPNADRLIALFVFIVTFALYLQTMAPTLGGGRDSAEFQHVAYTLGIAHPTGYPLYLTLGKVVTTLVPLGDVAYRMNLLSVFLSALAAVFVYLSIVLLTQRRWTALIATALFATNIAVWRQAGVASVSPLNLLLFAALMYTLLRWYWQGTRLDLVALVLGLGLAHHRSIILLVPAIAILLLLNHFKSMQSRREWIRLCTAFATPLLFYLYLPVFGHNSSWYSNTLEGFLGQISANEVGTYLRTTPEDFAAAIGTLTQFLFYSFGVLGWSVIALG